MSELYKGHHVRVGVGEYSLNVSLSVSQPIPRLLELQLLNISIDRIPIALSQFSPGFCVIQLSLTSGKMGLELKVGWESRRWLKKKNAEQSQRPHRCYRGFKIERTGPHSRDYERSVCTLASLNRPRLSLLSSMRHFAFSTLLPPGKMPGSTAGRRPAATRQTPAGLSQP
jgi:hypothetical protein